MEIKISSWVYPTRPYKRTVFKTSPFQLKIVVRDSQDKYVEGRYVNLSGNSKQRRKIRRAIFNVIGGSKNG